MSFSNLNLGSCLGLDLGDNVILKWIPLKYRPVKVTHPEYVKHSQN